MNALLTESPPAPAGTPARPSWPPLRVLFTLAGAHRVNRGAEVAFECVAQELAKLDGFEVTMMGSGAARDDRAYTFWTVPCVPRERFMSWPRVPVFRDHYVYEELTFLPGLWAAYDPRAYDITVACSYPFCNWVLRTKRPLRGGRPPHVYVTQNGDWPCQAKNREFRYFGCDGLVCTNPEFYATNREHWPSVLIPNGVDPARFEPGPGDRAGLGFPIGVPLVLMVSALIPTKRVIEGIRAVAGTPDMHMVVLGDGELGDEVRAVGRELLGERFQLRTLPYEKMPLAYRSVDVFLHMSQVEPSANAYMEALAAGLPIVTHDRPVTRWTLEREAILVNTDQFEDVAAALRRALDFRGPAQVASRRALVGRRYSWAAIAESYGDFLRQVVARRVQRGVGWWAPRPVGVEHPVS